MNYGFVIRWGTLKVYVSNKAVIALAVLGLMLLLVYVLFPEFRALASSLFPRK